MEGVPLKGRSGRRGMAGGRVLVKQVGLLESPGADISSGSVASAVAGAVLLCHSAAANASSIWQRVIENTSWKVQSSFLGHSGPFLFGPPVHFDPLSITFVLQLLSLFIQLTL